jgi:hypothetical protein
MLSVPPNPAAQPRVDRVVRDRGVYRLLDGTPTAGADLSNRLGVVTLPAGAEHITFVLVVAGDVDPPPLPF